VTEILRSAQSPCVLRNYVEAVSPLWDPKTQAGKRIKVRDSFGSQSAEFDLFGRAVIICAGAWTDRVGEMLLPIGHLISCPAVGASGL